MDRGVIVYRLTMFACQCPEQATFLGAELGKWRFPWETEPLLFNLSETIIPEWTLFQVSGRHFYR